jgi:glycosyltransferase involved in cell wall biosynthesis
MRIAIVSQEYPPETAHGGIGTQAYLKAHGLAARGHEVHVVSHSTDGRGRVYDDGPVRVLRILGYDDRLPVNTEAARWVTYSAEVAAAVSELHDRSPLDLVDFPEWACEGYVHLLNQAEWRHIPTVVQLHGPLVMFAAMLGWPEWESEFYRAGTAMEGACLRLADAVYSSSRCSAQWVADAYGLELDGIPVIHSGVDTKLFRPTGSTPDDRPTIVFAGKIARSKGVDVLFDACLLLAARLPDLRLSLAGRGDERLIDEMQSRAESAGLDRLLDVRGFVAREELPDLFSRSHVFAAPSLYEGGPGFVYLEAMSCGLPVIGCEGSGASEAIRHGETGYLVPPGDVEALENALLRLLEDGAQRTAMGAQARRYVETEASADVCVGRIEEFFQTVAGRTARQVVQA